MAQPNKTDFAVGIGGENGQGIASTDDILARIFARRGLHLNAYQSIIRGGHTFLTIRASDAPVCNMGDKTFPDGHRVLATQLEEALGWFRKGW